MIAKYNKASSEERIKASFLSDDVVLTPEDQVIKERCIFMFNLRLKKKYSRSQAIVFFEKEYDVSYSTANRIYNKAMLFFGELDFVHIRAERHILSEQYWQLYQKALRNEDIDQAGKMLERYGKLRDVEKSESELDFGKAKSNSYNIKIPRDIIKALRTAINENGVLDFNQYPEAEEVPYTELIDGE